MTDLQAKYQKLAAEYSKLRAQLPVLKKAVLDEQAVEEELKESLKEKDLSIRKYEQEVDSLTFRNNQLSSRVASLQQELEETRVHGKKHKKSSAQAALHDSRVNSSIVDEELRNKIEENALLHKQVYEADQEHRTEVLQLQERLSVLEREASQHETLMSSVLKENRDQITKLQEDKAVLEIKIHEQEKETKEAIKQASCLEEQLEVMKVELTKQVQSLSSVVQRKVPFDDGQDKMLNTLNIPPHNHQHQLQSRELISQANTLVQNLVQGFLDYLSRCEERSRLFAGMADSGVLSDISKRCCQHLSNHHLVLTPIRQTFQEFHDSLTDDSLIMLETVADVRKFATSWKNFVVFMQKLLPYQQLSLEEECALSSCPASLATKNMELHSSLQRLVSSLCVVDNYVTLLADQSHSPTFSVHSSHANLFEHLSRALNNLHESAKELSRHFNAKVSLEHQLPTVTQKLKIIDDCILTAVVSLVTSTSKISAFFSGNLTFFTYSSETLGKSFQARLHLPANPAISLLRQRASDYLSLIGRPPPESVPYTVALQNRKTVYSFTESKDSLTQQVVNLQERLSQLEQEREHWMLETQLMQVKYQKECQKVSSLQKSSLNTLEAQIENPVDAKPLHDGTTCGVINSSLLGRVDLVEGDSEESEMREELVTKHYGRRVAELTSNLQQADSKAVHFYAECRALQKRLVLCQTDRNKMQDELSKANQCVAQLKDELQTTSRSYEGQLSMMSEHLAAMNEKLTSQKDEIDILRHQLQQTSKDVKKGKKGR